MRECRAGSAKDVPGRESNPGSFSLDQGDAEPRWYATATPRLSCPVFSLPLSWHAVTFLRPLTSVVDVGFGLVAL